MSEAKETKGSMADWLEHEGMASSKSRPTKDPIIGTGIDQPKVKLIYQGRYVRDLGIVEEGYWKGWLVYRHPDGQWVTLADLKGEIDASASELIEEATKLTGSMTALLEKGDAICRQQLADLLNLRAENAALRYRLADEVGDTSD